MIRIYEANNNNVYYWNGIDEVPEDVVNVVIEDGVTEIGESAFEWHKNLKSVKIPDSVTKIGSDAFDSCAFQSIKIPDSVTEIGSGVFGFCKNLKSVNIPNSVVEIGKSAFFGCENLQSVNIPEGITEIGFGTFWKCKSLTSIKIPNSVKSIGKEAFHHCESLTNIVIPKSVKSVGKEAFYACYNLTDVQILGNPKIGNDAFTDTPVAKDFNPSKPNKNEVNGKNYNKPLELQISYAPYERYEQTFLQTITVKGKNLLSALANAAKKVGILPDRETIAEEELTAQDIFEDLEESNGDGDDFIQWIKIKDKETLFDSGWTDKDEEDLLDTYYWPGED